MKFLNNVLVKTSAQFHYLPLHHSQGGTVTPGGSTDAGALSTYEEAINPNAPSPSYDSLFGRGIRQVQKGILVVLEHIVITILGLLGCTLILGIPVCMMLMIVVGSIYLHICPQEQYIPVYLLVGGIFGVIQQLLRLSGGVKHAEEIWQVENFRQFPIQSLLNCFMFGWFIVGLSWVYTEYETTFGNRFGPMLGKYCYKNLDQVTIWLITSMCILLGIIVYILNYLYFWFYERYIEEF